MLRSRNDRALTDHYPELTGIDIKAGLVLGGEIVALDEAGRSGFELLQQRIHHTRPGRELQDRVPVTFVAFDLLHRGEEGLLAVPYASVVLPCATSDSTSTLESGSRSTSPGSPARRCSTPSPRRGWRAW